MKKLMHRKHKKPIAVCKKVKVVVKDNPDFEDLERLRELICKKDAILREANELVKDYIEPIQAIEEEIEEIKERLLIQ